jgi:hypothetical protein
MIAAPLPRNHSVASAEPNIRFPSRGSNAGTSTPRRGVDSAVKRFEEIAARASADGPSNSSLSCPRIPPNPHIDL